MSDKQQQNSLYYNAKMSDNKQRIKLHNRFTEAKYGSPSQSLDLSESSYRVKVDLTAKRRQHLVNLMRTKVSRLKVKEFKREIPVEYPKIARKDTAHAELRMLADQLPTAGIDKYVVREILRKTGMQERQKLYAGSVKVVVKEFSEDFVKVTHQVGMNFRVKPTDGSAAHVTLSPYKYHGRTSNYPTYLLNREQLRSQLCVHYPLMRKILKHAADLPEILMDFRKYHHRTHEMHSLRKAFLEELNTGISALQDFHRTISEAVSSYKPPKNPRYLLTATRLLASLLSRVLRNTITHLIEVTSDEHTAPYIQLYLYYKKEFELTPSGEDTYKLYEEMVYKITNSSKFPSLENPNEYIPIYLETEFLEDSFEQICTNTYTKYQPIDSHVDSIRAKFVALEVKTASRDLSFEEGIERVRAYKELISEVDRIQTNEYYPIGVLEQEYCKINLKKSIRYLIEIIATKLAKQHEWENDDICQTFQNLASRAEQIPQTSQELIDKGIYMATASTDLLEELNERIELMLVKIPQIMQITVISHDHMKLNSNAINWLLKIKPIIDVNAKMYENYKFDFEERLVNEVAQLNDDIAEIIPFLAILDSMNNSMRGRQYAHQMSNILVRIRNCEKQKVWINSEEKIFKYPVSPFAELEEVKAWIYNFYRLLKLCINWNRYYNAWMDGPFEFLTPAESERVVEEYEKQLVVIQKNYRNQLKQMAADNNPRRFQGSVDDPDPLNQPAPLQLCRQTLVKIEGFKPVLSLMAIVCNPALLQRHWDEMSEIAGFDMTPNAGTTLRKITAMDLGPNREGYEIISTGAIKELQLITNLREMIAEWDSVDFKTSTYKDTGLSILVGLDDVQVILDDHIIKTLAMRGSVFVKPYEEQVKGWYDKTVRMSATMDELARVQLKWLKLLPIFSSVDIANQMPLEAELFEEVDATCKRYMQVISDDPCVVKIAGGVGMLEALNASSSKLERIDEGVNNYLEKKRIYFPRFFFLSNAEMLEILSETKDPGRVQPHLKKLFESIDRLEFDDLMQIHAFISIEDEVVRFPKCIRTTDGGNVEEWLTQVEKGMFKAILTGLQNCKNQYSSTEPKYWMLAWPGQIVQTVTNMFWTAKVHQALRPKPCATFQELAQSSRNASKSTFLELATSERAKLLEIAKSAQIELRENVELAQNAELTNLNRLTVKSSIILATHSANVISQLIENNITSETDFQWVAQLRYYWEDSCCKVRILNGTFNYGCEYLGSSERLVVTPLTERCFRSLTSAYYLQLNGAPIGPASSGKTETVKDLAKALGVRCLVFNCSDGINYKIMGKFFKGAAASGAWVCFDEFNRIELEVLSVLAQQILCITEALKINATCLNFEGTELKLNSSCFVSLTMNPGYSGRSELPDNLKVSFRTVAMMVPDFALIAEVTLLANGFNKAGELGVKVATAYELCSQQFSSQSHYDFSLRSIKSALQVSGIYKLRYPEEDEDAVVLEAIRECNRPKLLEEDLQIFEGILEDVFKVSGVQLMKKEAVDKLIESISDSLAGRNLQLTDSLLAKVLQTFELLQMKHGFMLVGDPFVGKTTTVKVLADAINGASESKVIYQFINPKSLTVKQLYGQVDRVTNEWIDGVLSMCFRRFAENTTNDRKWIIFDGPVDSLWVENMNSVLDDNRKLCLTSGEIVPMSSSMSMIFEVQDLAQASPSTISRCGMIYFEPTTLGWRPLVESWKTNKNPDWYKDNATMISKYFDWLVDPCLEFIKCNCKQVCALGDISLVKNMFQIFEMILDDACESATKKEDDYKYMVCWVQASIISAGVWGLGAVLEQDSRVKFDGFYRSLWKGEFEEHKYPTGIPKLEMLLPGDGLLMDYYYVYKLKGSWKYWHDIVRGLRIDDAANIQEAVIPTVETSMFGGVFDMHVRHKNPFLLVGGSGTGKSFYMRDYLLNKLDQEKHEASFLTFTVNISANEAQDLFISKLHKVKRGHYGGPKGKCAVIFVDDLNTPEKEVYGAQPAIELLRYHFDHGNWYDLKDMGEIFMHGVMVVGAMGLVGGSRKDVSPRFLRHFNIYAINEFLDESIAKIFTNVLGLAYKSNAFPNDVINMVNSMVAASLEVYSFAREKLRPTPSKTHYLFNLRDFSRVMFGCALLKKESAEDKRIFPRLWMHESMRVFYDRLVDRKDRKMVYEKLRGCVEEQFKEEFSVVFEDYATNENDEVDLMFRTTLNGEGETLYEEVNMEAFEQTATLALNEYNNLEGNCKMDLVLFNYALEHLSRISRVLSIPASSGLLIGVNGTGRQSLTKLATSMVGYAFFQPEISNGYGINEWRDDVKLVLKEAGGNGNPSTFMVSDEQIVDESFLQDIDCLLNAGEVPNMFAMDEKQEVLEMVRLDAQGGNRNLDITALTVFAYFVKRCREKLHMILCFSPISREYRNRLRTYPSLINSCTLDWFDPWPESALESVGNAWIKDLNIEEAIKQSIIGSFKHFHETAQDVAHSFHLATSRKTYVTSASYLELIKSFNYLTVTKQGEITSNKNRYLAGLEKLQNAADAVATMQRDLADFQPRLQEMTARAIEMTKQIATETIEVEKASAVVREDEKLANIQAANSQYLKRECEADLADAIPILEDAIEALNTLKPSDITLVKSMKNPPEAVKLVMAGVCVMRDIKPDRINDASTGGKILDYWGPSKRLLGDMNFLQHLKDFDKDHIKAEIMVKIRKEYLPNKLFKPQIVAKASSAAEGLCKWIIAMDMYDAVAKEVAPKKEKLELAEKEYQTTVAFLMEKKQQLAKLEEKLAHLNEALDEAKTKQKELQDNVDRCAGKLLRAEKLLGSLGGEKVRWIQAADRLQLLFDSLAGDVLISAGLIAYLSPYTVKYRVSTTSGWMDYIKNLNIPCSENFDFSTVLGSDFKIQSWRISGLPRNTFSTENAIIQDSSQRWSLLIDPQSQANIWIKRMEKENGLLVTKLSGDFIATLTQAIQFGKPVLIESVLENLAPVLDPILHKSTSKNQIRFSKKTIPYHGNFRLYLTSKLRNPHHLPEIANKLTVVNFGIILDGLEDQLLDIVVAKERPELQEQCEELIAQSAENKSALADVEESILKTLSESKGDILEDERAIEVLDNSKIRSLEIVEKQENLKRRELQIEDSRMDFKSIAVHSALLYFSVSDLPNVDPMYQFSLEWFINLYIRSIESANKSRVLERRLRYLNDAFTYNLYTTVCMALFGKDKLMFAFLLCTKILIAQNAIGEDELNFLLTVGFPVSDEPNPHQRLVTDQDWNSLCNLQLLPAFEGFKEEFVAKPEGWQYPEKLTRFQKLIITKILQRDQFHISVSKFVSEEMGARFVTPPPFDLSRSFEESSCICPLVLILSPGNDPMEALTRFAERKRLSKLFSCVSLGQAQGPIALKAIERAQQIGGWVCLQNCHLASSWMPDLEKVLESVELANTHANFRVWLTSHSSDAFPISILQSSVKISNETPSNLQKNLLRSYTSEPLKDPQFFSGCPGKEDMFARLLYGVAFFHAVIQERRSFGPLGWNAPYNFNETDFTTSIIQLQTFINDHNKITFQALPYLIGECNYGGRLMDDWDRRLLLTILADCFNENLATSMKYQLMGVGNCYGLPRRFNYDDYLEHIKTIPELHPSEVFGLHGNAGTSKDIRTSGYLLDAMIKIQGETPSGFNRNTDYSLVTIASEILAKLPEDINASKGTSSKILIQEMQRYNNLLRVIKNTLQDVQRAVQGYCILSITLEALADSLLDGRVPDAWLKQSYPTLKSLPEYVSDFRARCDFFQRWAEDGPPGTFWLSAFFNTGAFLAGVKQEHSRRFDVPVAQLDFDFEVLPEGFAAREFGACINGMFTDGARWDVEAGVLRELRVGVLHERMPVVWLKPVLGSGCGEVGWYRCPVYRTSERRGVVSTSGHSTNFVLSVLLETDLPAEHWVKRGVALLCQVENY